MDSTDLRRTDLRRPAGARWLWRIAGAAAGDGHVYLINDVTGRYLDANLGDNVKTSSRPNTDDRWLLSEDEGTITLRNVQHGGYLTGLDASANYNVVRSADLSIAATWQFEILD